VLTPAAVAFVEGLTRRFRPRIEELLIRRRAAQQRLDNGERLDFLSETAEIRRSDWRVAPIPDDLRDRRVGITGPVARSSHAPFFCSHAHRRSVTSRRHHRRNSTVGTLSAARDPDRLPRAPRSR
jgi:malate synthase